MTRPWLLALLLLLPAIPAAAQGPAADWRTVETAHFRIHYPQPYEAWALRAASRIESIHAAVSTEVGFVPPQKIDVLISNPVAEPNGSAWPLLDAPRILFWTEPPGPEEQIGSYSHWIDLLAVHEVAHVVHMLRPTRRPLRRLLEKSILPLNSITLGAPRWVLEGYATVIEGRLTGAGRPSSTMRAIILRKWAQNGRLPSYEQLDSDQRFVGMSMAYLMGSAYLEWLEQRGGPESLRNLWRRMTARQQRSFEEAFAGVYGDSPERLYGRFVAELTEAAVVVSRADAREGELWQETTRASGDPAVSPDGKQIAVVVRPQAKPAQLVIWSTEPPTKEEEEYEKRLAKIRERDPEDVMPVRTKPLPRKPLHTFSPADGGDLQTPRWTRDGRSLIYSHRMPDSEGFLHHDLFRWTPEGGENVRLTELADVRDADPIDANRAVAVRSRYGATELVLVDLNSGAVTPLTDASIDAVYSHPRVSPDATRIAYVVHREGRWRLETATIEGSDVVRFPLSVVRAAPGVQHGTDNGHRTTDNGGNAAITADAASPEWATNDTIIATLSSRGFAELHRINLTTQAVTPITQSSGAAVEPAPAGDRIFFMGLEPDGFVVRVITPADTPPAERLFDRPLVPALPPEPPKATPFTAAELPPSRPYGIGRQEFAWFTGSQLAPEQRGIELGVRFGDVVGRLDTLVIGALGSKSAFDGAAIVSRWRGTRVNLQGHAFTADDGRDDLQGLELRALWDHRGAFHYFNVEGGALGGSDRNVGFLDSSYTRRQRGRSWGAAESLRIAGEFGDFTHIAAEAGLQFRLGGTRLGAEFRHDTIDDEHALSVGGVLPSILPRTALALRVLDPALPPGTLTGDRYQRRRLELDTPFLPATLFYTEHRTGDESLTLAGLEATLWSDPLPILNTPGLDFTLGVARILTGPLEDETKWWLSIRWHP
ncbi:MAG TPA: hypothetical protein VF618_13270 [Thermoanaerobaculia bacterium]